MTFGIPIRELHVWIISASVSGDETGRILLCYFQGAVFSRNAYIAVTVDRFFFFFYPKDDSIIRG